MKNSILLWFLVTFYVPLVFGLTLTSTSSPDCTIHHTYGVMDPISPTFLIRSGYSRDNDDPAEGNYETAVLDLELVGRTLPSGKTCLYLISTIGLSSETANAEGWAKGFFVRKMGAWKKESAEMNWQLLEAPQTSASNLTVQYLSQASFLFNEKYIPFEAPRSESKVAHFNYQFLGKLESGFYKGRVFFQSPSGNLGNTPLFQDVDDSNYRVRHVLEWSLILDSGKLVSPTNLITADSGSSSYSSYANQVRLVQPRWNRNSLENKAHSVKLMWRDIIENAVRKDLYSQLKQATPPSDEILGRCRLKPKH